MNSSLPLVFLLLLMINRSCGDTSEYMPLTFWEFKVKHDPRNYENKETVNYLKYSVYPVGISVEGRTTNREIIIQTEDSSINESMFYEVQNIELKNRAQILLMHLRKLMTPLEKVHELLNKYATGGKFQTLNDIKQEIPIKRIINYTRTTVCSRNGLRQQCSAQCMIQDNSSGHFNCSSDGTRICLPNQGKRTHYCSSKFDEIQKGLKKLTQERLSVETHIEFQATCEPNPCENNGTCEIIDKAVFCHCQEPSYGPRCQACKVYLNENYECRPIPQTGNVVGDILMATMILIYILMGLSGLTSFAFIMLQQVEDEEAESEESEDEKDEKGIFLEGEKDQSP